MAGKFKEFYIFLPVIFAGGILSYLYRLKWPCLIVMAAAFAMALPVWERGRRIRKEQQQRFTDANIYMEQMLYSFRKNNKILSALTDVERLFAAGQMKDCMKKALSYMKDTYGEGQITEKALSFIESDYPAQRIGYVHQLMLKTERLGGDCEASVRILLKDRDVWEKETVSYQKRCQFQKRNITAAILLSCLLCLLTPILCQGALKEVNVTDSLLYQASTLFMLLLSLGLYLVTEKYFTRDWLAGKKYQDSKISLDRYYKVVNYDFSKEKKKSLCMAVPALVLLAVFLFTGHWFLVAGLFPVCLLLAFSYKVDYGLAKKAVIHEIRKAFPDWLMEVSLLLQTENVQNSIRKSREFAPDILRPQLNDLVENLEAMPESNIPYSRFLQEFAIPEAASAMGMLYSLSDGSGSDADVQMEEILSRNARWMGESEALSNSDKVAKMYLLFLIPALFGSLKMVLDMTLILFAFFSQAHL